MPSDGRNGRKSPLFYALQIIDLKRGVEVWSRGNETWETVACEQALRGDLAAARIEEGELVTTSLEFEFHL